MIIWTCKNCGNVSNSKQVCLNCGYDAEWISTAEPMSEQAEKIAQAEEKSRDFWMAYEQALKEVNDAEQLLMEARERTARRES